jgi:crotonobetainyl-CoA:carnitine CoA-transferase CaiB-like acyl-CoA transferase
LIWFAQETGIVDEWDPDLLDIVKLRNEDLNQKLHAKLRELFLTRTAAEWEEIGNEAGAAIGWCRTVDEWIDTEHAQVLGAVTELDDPEYGPTWMTGVPVNLSVSKGGPKGPRHLPDADRDSILKEAANPPSKETPAGTESILAHPLQGMKVLDVCVALAGPTCGRLLYEFGADVIKINPPKGGVGGYLNRGKDSLLLDLESFDAQAVYWNLVKDADIIVENFSPGTAERLGVSYGEAKARNPDIIYMHGSAYGDGGTWKGRGWERQGQAVAGIMERASDPPSVLGPYNIIDIGTGSLATFGTALAIYHKLRTGEGQMVSASLCQTGTYQQTPYMLRYKGYVADEPRGYGALGTGPLNRFYQASDKWFFLALQDNEAEEKLAKVQGLDVADLKGTLLEMALARTFEGETAAVWVQRLRDAGIPAQEIVPVADLMQDPYVRQRSLSISQEVPGVGKTTAPGIPVRFSRTPMRVGEPHQPGSDAAKILASIGMADDLPMLEKAWVLQTQDLPSAW